jgi:hypothetical protein
VILQTVSINAANPPPAPFVQRAPDGGWHFDCGNCVGWSFDVPKPCRCGLCHPMYESVRAAVALPIARARRAAAQRDRLFWNRLARMAAR